MTPEPDPLDALAAHLRRAARERRTATYAEVAPAAGLDVARPEDRRALAALLYEINRREHAAGRPLLSAVVCLAGRRTPGRGFFRCARELGAHPGGDDGAFWRAERQRVYGQWARR